MYFCGWLNPQLLYHRRFLLEAKANWGHTGIAGGFIVPRYNKKEPIIHKLNCYDRFFFKLARARPYFLTMVIIAFEVFFYTL